MNGWDQQRMYLFMQPAWKGKDVTTMNKITEGLIVIGNESKGISPAVMNW